jgi:hypothetical protein
MRKSRGGRCHDHGHEHRERCSPLHDERMHQQAAFIPPTPRRTLRRAPHRAARWIRRVRNEQAASSIAPVACAMLPPTVSCRPPVACTRFPCHPVPPGLTPRISLPSPGARTPSYQSLSPLRIGPR